MWMALAGLGLQAAGSYYQQRAQNAALKYQAAMNRQNARLERMGAESALRQGERQAQQVMNQAAKVKGAQKTGYAANGIDLSSRSARQVMNETDFFGEADKNQVEANALSSAWQHRLNAVDMENNANVALSQRQSPWGAALSSLVSGAAGGYLQNHVAEAIDTAAGKAGDWIRGQFSGSGQPGLYGYSPTLLGSATGAARTWPGYWGRQDAGAGNLRGGW
ncbi:MAG: hypothetical protein NC211_00715 [Alistipes senegalensis]|nr:hypothetical protein [Oxalobacter formigenes]MCM1280348.1 hypothetical protein [Alistipes senegalensis]